MEATPQVGLHPAEAFLGELHVSGVLVTSIADSLLEPAHDLRDTMRIGTRCLSRACDDERHTRLIDHDGIGFVHYREVEGTLDQIVSLSSK